MSPFRDAGAVREEVERRLRHPVDEADWQLLEERGRVEDVLREERAEDVEDALGAIVQHLRDWGGRSQGRRRRRAQPREALLGITDERTAALWRLAELEAADLPEVRAFRREVLRGRLLKPARVPAWLRRAERRQAKPSAAGPLTLLPYHPGRGVGWAEHVVVGEEGPLRRLWETVESLRRRLGWSPWVGVLFVLAGGTPGPALGTGGLTRRSHPIGDRVRLEVHPSASQAQVAAFYEQIRRRGAHPVAAALHPRSEGRTRDLSTNHARLAVFVADANDGRSWEEARRAWNRRYTAAAYDDVRPFRRDARAAYQRIRGEPLRWHGGKAASG